MNVYGMSPSSRRAWIEIHEKVVREWLDYVALLAEGVDRNKLFAVKGQALRGRPPRGGRG